MQSNFHKYFASTTIRRKGALYGWLTAHYCGLSYWSQTCYLISEELQSSYLLPKYSCWHLLSFIDMDVHIFVVCVSLTLGKNIQKYALRSTHLIIVYIKISIHNSICKERCFKHAIFSFVRKLFDLRDIRSHLEV